MKKRGAEGLILGFIVITIIVAFLMAFLANESIGLVMITFLPAIISLILILIFLEPLKKKDKTAVIIAIPLVLCALAWTIQSEFELTRNVETIVLVINFIIALAATLVIYYFDRHKLLKKAEKERAKFGIKSNELAKKNVPKEIKQANREIVLVQRKIESKQANKRVMDAFKKVQRENYELQRKFGQVQKALVKEQLDVKYKAIEDLKDIVKDSSNYGLKLSVNQVNRDSNNLRQDLEKLKDMVDSLDKY